MIYLSLITTQMTLKDPFSLTTTECNLHVQPLYSSQSFLFIVSLYT